MSRLLGVLWASLFFSVAAALSAADATTTKPAAEPGRNAAAANDVSLALAAELGGDNAQRDLLLARALAEDPNCRAARWQSGEVNVRGKWLTVAEAIERFKADSNLTEYRRRRNEAAAAGLFTRITSDTVAGATGVGATTARGSSAEVHRPAALSAAGLAAHADLARWCRTKGLADEERAHWTQVLLDEPTNAEAQSRLGLKPFMGTLMTIGEIDALKKQHALEEKQLADWKTIILRWQKSLDRGSDTEREQAAAEMEATMDAGVIPALESAIAADVPKQAGKRDLATHFQRAAIALLGRLPQQRATFSLTGYSVLAPQGEVRELAAVELKSRPLHDFVPLLLAGLANPIRFEYAMAFDASAGVAIYRAVASQEGSDAIREIEYSSTASGLRPKVDASRTAGADTVSSVDFTGANPTKTTTTKYDVTRINITPGPRNLGEVPGAMALARQGQGLTASIAGTNARIAEMNRRIDFVLSQVAPPDSKTTKSPDTSAAKKSEDASEAAAIPDAALAGGTPASAAPLSTADYWWNWWSDYNESHSTPKETYSANYSDSFSLTNQDHYTSTYTQTSEKFVYNQPVLHFHPDIPGNPYHCFAAGNLVVTAVGPTAIERLQVGDRVLAQDPTTGELAFKPVLATTKNSPAKLLRVVTSSGEIRLTLGHPFWIEGKGWRMAKELAVGDRVRGLSGSVTIKGIEKDADEPIYNLTVADFGTFFIGDAEVLVHDNTVRLPTRSLVPGYATGER